MIHKKNASRELSLMFCKLIKGCYKILDPLVSIAMRLQFLFTTC